MLKRRTTQLFSAPEPVSESTSAELPYTLPEDDPFNIVPALVQQQQQPRRRRSSLLDKWIQEQHTLPGECPSTPTSNPYGAIGLDAPTSSKLTLNSFVLVDEDELPEDCDGLGSLQVP